MEKRRFFGIAAAVIGVVSTMTAFYANIDPATITKNLMAAGFPRWTAEFVSTLPSWLFQWRLWVIFTCGAVLFALWARTKKPKESVGTEKPAGERVRLDALFESMMATVSSAATNKERLDKFEQLSIGLHDALGSNPSFHAYGRKMSKNWVDDLVDHVPGLMPIPPKFWTEDDGEILWHTVDITKLRERCIAQSHSGGSDGPGFFDLRFDRDQLLALWPDLKLAD